MEHLKALTHDETAFALPERMHQEMASTMAKQHQHLEWFLHYVSTQEQTVQELLTLQPLDSYRSSDWKEEGLNHQNLIQTKKIQL